MKTSFKSLDKEARMKMRQTFSDEDIIELYWQRNEDAIRVTNDK